MPKLQQMASKSELPRKTTEDISDATTPGYDYHGIKSLLEGWERGNREVLDEHGEDVARFISWIAFIRWQQARSSEADFAYEPGHPEIIADFTHPPEDELQYTQERVEGLLSLLKHKVDTDPNRQRCFSRDLGNYNVVEASLDGDYPGEIHMWSYKNAPHIKIEYDGYPKSLQTGDEPPYPYRGEFTINDNGRFKAHWKIPTKELGATLWLDPFIYDPDRPPSEPIKMAMDIIRETVKQYPTSDEK